jgi:hypothetical protein
MTRGARRGTDAAAAALPLACCGCGDAPGVPQPLRRDRGEAVARAPVARAPCGGGPCACATAASRLRGGSCSGANPGSAPRRARCRGVGPGSAAAACLPRSCQCLAAIAATLLLRSGCLPETAATRLRRSRCFPRNRGDPLAPERAPPRNGKSEFAPEPLPPRNCDEPPAPEPLPSRIRGDPLAPELLPSPQIEEPFSRSRQWSSYLGPRNPTAVPPVSPYVKVFNYMITFVSRNPTTRTSSLAPMSRKRRYQTRARADLTVAGRAGTIRTVITLSAHTTPKPVRDRQVYGYWFGPSDGDIPSAPMGRLPGAVLPEIGKDLHAPELICLDLVPVDNYWLVLSEVGRYTYRHTTGLL